MNIYNLHKSYRSIKSIAILTIYKQLFWYLNFANHRTKESFVTATNKPQVGTLMTIGDVTVSIAIRENNIIDGESIHVFESNQATRMQIAFGKLLEFWFIFSRWRSVFACWRSFYPFLNEKVFLFHCKCCIEIGFSRCSSQGFAAFTVLICLVTTLRSCWHYCLAYYM